MEHVMRSHCETLMDNSEGPPCYDLYDCSRHYATFLCGTFTTVLVHNPCTFPVPCWGDECWICSRAEKPKLHCYASVDLVAIRRDAVEEQVVILEISEESIARDILAMAADKKTLHGLTVAIRSANHVVKATGQDRPRGMQWFAEDPLQFMVPVFGPWARYGILGHAVQLELPNEQLPVPLPCRSYGLTKEARAQHASEQGGLS